MNNRMGGIIKVELTDSSNVITYEPTLSGKVSLVLNPSGGWLNLPLYYMQSVPTDGVKDEDAGVLHDQSLSLSLILESSSLVDQIKMLATYGCIAKVTLANEKVFIFGSPKYDLLGALKLSPGSKPSEAFKYELNLASRILTEPLELQV